MLETGNQLQTWRLLQEPAPGLSVPAEPLADHRIAYLDYEGPISNNRGTVQRWDSGTYEVLSDTDEWFTVQLNGSQGLSTAKLCQQQNRLTWDFA